MSTFRVIPIWAGYGKGWIVIGPRGPVSSIYTYKGAADNLAWKLNTKQNVVIEADLVQLNRELDEDIT